MEMPTKHPLGKGEVDSSILSGSTSFPAAFPTRTDPKEPVVTPPCLKTWHETDTAPALPSPDTGLDNAAGLSVEDRSQISDGYHTFAELYEHRHALFIALCAHWPTWNGTVWRAQQHADGTMFPGWFVAGIGKEPGKQITYHLPDRLWPRLDFAETLLRAPEWDGHSPADVVQRILRSASDGEFEG